MASDFDKKIADEVEKRIGHPQPPELGEEAFDEGGLPIKDGIIAILDYAYNKGAYEAVQAVIKVLGASAALLDETDHIPGLTSENKLGAKRALESALVTFSNPDFIQIKNTLAAIEKELAAMKGGK